MYAYLDISLQRTKQGQINAKYIENKIFRILRILRIKIILLIEVSYVAIAADFISYSQSFEFITVWFCVHIILLLPLSFFYLWRSTWQWVWKFIAYISTFLCGRSDCSYLTTTVIKISMFMSKKYFIYFHFRGYLTFLARNPCFFRIRTDL